MTGRSRHHIDRKVKVIFKCLYHQKLIIFVRLTSYHTIPWI